jgi:hypothetical protein
MPSLTGPCGAPLMLPNSYWAVSTLPPDDVIVRSLVLFEMPPFLSTETGVADAADGDNELATTH